jgi:small subunit ribosomal protein S11
MAKTEKKLKKISADKSQWKTKKGLDLIKKIKSKGIHEVVIHIKTSKNNSIVAVSDFEGNVLFKLSCGMIELSGNKLRNSRKKTPFAAQSLMTEVGRRVKDLGINSAKISIKGVGYGRDLTTLQCLVGSGLRINEIEDCSSIAHAGCRPPKARSM